MDWKECYARRFLENPISEDDIQEAFEKIAEEINGQFRRLCIDQHVDADKKLYFRDFIIDYEIDKNIIYFSKRNVTDKEKVAEVLVIYENSHFSILLSGKRIVYDYLNYDLIDAVVNILVIG